MDRTDICMECQKPIRWIQHGHAQNAWALFTGQCACARKTHSAVKPQRPRAA